MFILFLLIPWDMENKVEEEDVFLEEVLLFLDEEEEEY
jgi:hypothetical protein